ncbi:hypothetical protein AV530_014654 [Patagioenas fasciata monilis]|uniref:Uncharacterized protein n=1 Tax=Patagioenas fasciata monilis TaxID=372326 RepID=A0A1V4KBB5_PATFA|nr:hypothetical protein AV530_014654 [Patagioenas fasciata monilis]
MHAAVQGKEDQICRGQPMANTKGDGNTSHTDSHHAALTYHALQQAESFCWIPLSSACGWTPKSNEDAAAAQLHQCCADKLSTGAEHQRLL